VLLEEMTKMGDSESMWILGLCCEYGIGVERNLSRAKKLYQKSSDSSNAVGDFLLKNDNYGGKIGKMTSL